MKPSWGIPAVAALFVVVSADLAAGQFGGDTTCAYSELGPPGPPSNELTVTTEGSGFPFVLNVNSKIVIGDDLQLRYDIPCSGGTPTTSNVDRLNLVAGPKASLNGNMDAAVLHPGATPEADGTSELEAVVVYGNRENELTVRGSAGPDQFQVGRDAAGVFGVNVNPGEPSADLDVEVMSGSLAIDGAGGPDMLAVGGVGLTTPRSPITFFGSAGRDTLIGGPDSDFLHGGRGRDRLVGLGGDDYLDGSDGSDRASAGTGRDAVFVGGGGGARVNCGGGQDFAGRDRGDRLHGCERVIRTSSFFAFLKFAFGSRKRPGGIGS